MALPSRLGGLGLSAPTNRKEDFENSVSFTTQFHLLPTHKASHWQITPSLSSSQLKYTSRTEKQTIGNPWPLTSAQKHLLTYNYLSVSFTTHSQSQSLADNTLTEQFTAKIHFKNRKTNHWESMASYIC